MLYRDVGNIPGNFELGPRRIVEPRGLLFCSSLLTLKEYAFSGEGVTTKFPLTTTFLARVERNLEKRVLSGEIDPEIGLGFAIFSHDGEHGYVNVARWLKDCPIVLRNSLYVFDRDEVESAKSIDVGKEGAFCIYELDIVSHEVRAWTNYLASQRREEDKVNYLHEQLKRGPLFST